MRELGEGDLEHLIVEVLAARRGAEAPSRLGVGQTLGANSTRKRDGFCIFDPLERESERKSRARVIAT